jgi:MFS family permease
MLEIIAIILLSEKISTKARLKGYLNTGRFVFLFVLMWCVFEIIGSVIGTVIFNQVIITWFVAIIFAVIGAYLSFFIVDKLKTKEILTDYDSNVQIDLPFTIKLWKENITTIITVSLASALLAAYLSYYFLIIPVLIFGFTKYGISEIIFQPEEITYKYFYGEINY